MVRFIKIGFSVVRSFSKEKGKLVLFSDQINSSGPIFGTEIGVLTPPNIVRFY